MPEFPAPLIVDSPERLYTSVAAGAITPSDTNPLLAKKAKITDHNGILYTAAATGTAGNAVTVDFNAPTNEATTNTIGVVGNAVTVTLKSAGTKAILENQGIRYESVTKGTGGNSVRVRYVNPGTASAAQSVSVSSNDITVNLATNAGDNATLTNQGITYTAVAAGTGGNSITLAIVNPGPDGELGVEVTGTDIVATLETDSGTSQVETATAAGTVSGNGNAIVTVTGAGIAGSPLAVSVAVLNGDTPSAWATKARTALNGTAAITALYTIGGTGTAITLTETVPNGNDATLNIALATGTATGITAAPTSANTTAGVAPAILTELDELYNLLLAESDVTDLVTLTNPYSYATAATLAETALSGGGANIAITSTREQVRVAVNASGPASALVTAFNSDENPLKKVAAMGYTSLAGGTVKSNVTVSEIVAALNANVSFAALAVASVPSLAMAGNLAQPGASVQLAGGAAGQWSLDYNFTRALSVNVAGNVAYLPFNGGDAVTVALVAGVQYPISTRGINATNTTATGITGYV